MQPAVHVCIYVDIIYTFGAVVNMCLCHSKTRAARRALFSDGLSARRLFRYLPPSPEVENIENKTQWMMTITNNPLMATISHFPSNFHRILLPSHKTFPRITSVELRMMSFLLRMKIRIVVGK